MNPSQTNTAGVPRPSPHPPPIPGKKEAAPAKVAASSGEQETCNTEVGGAQVSALERMREAWLRCDRNDRQMFLSDIRAGCPNLWRAVEREGNGGSR